MKKFLFFCLVLPFLLSGCTTDKNTLAIKKGAKIHENDAYNIAKIIDSVGFPNIDYVKCSTNGNYKHCTIENYDALFNISLELENNKIKFISDYKGILYTDNSIKKNYNDANISKTDFINLVENSKNITKQNLKSPHSANFKNWEEWQQAITKDYVELSSFVDSQNSFGAYISTPIEFKYKRVHGISGKYQLSEAQIGTIKIKN